MTGPLITDLLTILQRHFPEESDTIRQRLDEDPTLKEIEENYRDCVTALQYWRGSEAPEAHTRIREYSTFSKEIEQEAVTTYEAHVSPSRT